MTMKIADVAPNEAMLVDLAEQLSRAESSDELKRTIFELGSSYLEAAEAMLESLPREWRPRTATFSLHQSKLKHIWSSIPPLPRTQGLF